MPRIKSIGKQNYTYHFYMKNKERIDAIIDKILNQFNIYNLKELLYGETGTNGRRLRKTFENNTISKQKYLIFEPVIASTLKNLKKQSKSKNRKKNLEYIKQDK